MQATTTGRSLSIQFERTAKLLVSGRLLRLAVPVYLLLMLLVWGVLLNLWIGGADGRDRSGVALGPDFTAFYTGGWLLWHGQSADLYDLSSQAAIQQMLFPDYAGVSAYLNPPHYALIFAPLSSLSYTSAFAVWTIFMASAFIATVWLIDSFVCGERGKQHRMLGVLTLLSPPVYYALSAGQNTGLTLLLHTIILVALLQGKDGLAGGVVALGLIKPQLFVVLLPVLLLTRRWRALLWFSIVASIIGVITLSVGGLTMIEQWFAVVRSETYSAEIARQVTKMFSWQSFWHLVLGSNIVASVFGWAFALLGFLSICWIWVRNYGDIPFRYAMTVYGLLLMGPHVFVYDLGLLVLPTLIIADRLLRIPSSQYLGLRVSLLALFTLSLFAADVQLRPALVIVPLITLIWWQALRLPATPLLQEH